MFKLICCLGNPGLNFENTRHNVGFLIGDYLIQAYDFEKYKKKCKSILYKGMIEGQSVIIQKPETYMNLSGEAVQHTLHYFKIQPEDMMVIYDDIDLPFPSLRYRATGGAGTHNGMRSIIEMIKNKNFPRLRVGVGPQSKQMSLSDFVLSKFSSTELNILDNLYPEIKIFIDNAYQLDIGEAMKRLHTKKEAPKTEEPSNESTD